MKIDFWKLKLREKILEISSVIFAERNVHGRGMWFQKKISQLLVFLAQLSGKQGSIGWGKHDRRRIETDGKSRQTFGEWRWLGNSTAGLCKIFLILIKKTKKSVLAKKNLQNCQRSRLRFVCRRNFIDWQRIIKVPAYCWFWYSGSLALQCYFSILHNRIFLLCWNNFRWC